MNDSNVKKALNAAALDFLTVVTEIDTSKGLVANLPTVSTDAIAWENRKFKPPVGALWSSVFYVPNNAEARTVGVGGIDQLTGFMQIDFNVGVDTGDGDLNDWEDKSRLYFPGGRGFDHEGQNVLVISSSLGQGRTVDNNFRKSLTVFFTAQLKRTILT